MVLLVVLVKCATAVGVRVAVGSLACSRTSC